MTLPGPSATPRHSIVTASDGVTLAVFEYGDPTHPTVVAIHGYPDDHHVWDGVIAHLADRFHVVAYDVRGSGASSAPSARSGYRIAQLVADLGAVITATVPADQGHVHLLAHDWGSVQSWDALTDPALAPRIASFTSISGPSLDMTGRWLRGRGHLAGTARQLAASYYVFAFQAPKLPEAMIRRGLLARLVDLSKKGGADAHPTGSRMATRDALNGLGLYRANVNRPMARPQSSRITVPVQVIAPRDDAHVTVALQCGAPAPYVADLTTHVINGNHWVVEQDPGLIVEHLTRFISTVSPT